MKQQIMRVRHPKTNEWVTINKGKDSYSSTRENTKQIIKNERRASVQMSQRWLDK